MPHPVYTVRYFAVPLNSSLLTITLHSSFITALLYNDTKIPFMTSYRGSTKQVAQVTAVCYNPLITQSQRSKRRLDRSSAHQHLRMPCFYGNIKDKHFFLWAQHFDRRRVCNPSGVPRGGLGCSNPPRNSEDSPKLCQTQTDL